MLAISILATVFFLCSQSALAYEGYSTYSLHGASEIRLWTPTDKGNRFLNLAVKDGVNKGDFMIRGRDWVGHNGGLDGWELAGIIFYCYSTTLAVQVELVNSVLTIDLATEVPTTSNTTATVSPRRCF
jgi:hypothetical protein